MPIGVCVGIDPSPDTCQRYTSPARAGERSRTSQATRMLDLATSIIEGARTGGAVAVKPQMAWFERAGAPGIAALEHVVDRARSAGLLVVLDGKRGDVPHTARAYAEAYLGDEASSGICADAITVNAWLGSDALAAMCTVAGDRACGIYALLLTSNSGSAALTQIRDESGTPWWRRVAEMIRDHAAGAVVGATRPEHLAEAISVLPDTPLLIPGIGAQGGRLDDVVACAQPATAPILVTASRSLLPEGTSPVGTLVDSIAAQVEALVQQVSRAAQPE